MNHRHVIQDVFESLFQEYSEIQTRPQPRFKKILKKSDETETTGNKTSTHADDAIAAQASTSLPNLPECQARLNLTPRRAVSHHGSFSSGIFSMDSDTDCPTTEGDLEQSTARGMKRVTDVQPRTVCKPNKVLRGKNGNKLPGRGVRAVRQSARSRIRHSKTHSSEVETAANDDTLPLLAASVGRRVRRSTTHTSEVEDTASDDTLSEAGSGYACRRCGADDDRGDDEDAAVTSDQSDALQTMKSPTGEPHSAAGQERLMGTGVLTDEDVMFMMHKPRVRKKGRKKPPWQKRKIDLDELWLKGQHRWTTPKEETTGQVTRRLYLNRNLEQGKILLKRYISLMKAASKGRKVPKKSKGKGSSGHHAKATMSKERVGGTEKADRSKTSSASGREQKSVGKEKKRQTVGESSGKQKRRSTSKDPLTKSGRIKQTPVTSFEEGNRGSNNMRCGRSSDGVSGNKKNSCESAAVQPSPGIKRSITIERRVSSNKDCYPALDSHNLGVKASSKDLSSDSEDSLINFVSLTPGKSRKQSRARRWERVVPAVADALPLEQTQSRNPGINKRDTLLRDRGLQSLEDSDGDVLLPSYPPLFGRSRHCGGVWNSIVEES